MCEWGDQVDVLTRIQWPEGGPPQGSISEAYIKSLPQFKQVDRCLAPLVEVLNNYGIQTIACCCGHGKTPYSSIGVHPKNIELVPMGRFWTVHLKFPYKGR